MKKLLLLVLSVALLSVTAMASEVKMTMSVDPMDLQTMADSASKAETAQSGAETAQEKAEKAQTEAEAAQDKAETARAAAETAQVAAETAKADVEAAKEATTSHVLAVQGIKDEVAKSKDAAETANKEAAAYAETVKTIEDEVSKRATTVAAKVGELHISVADYGAIGDYDPITKAGTDNVAAIQKALDALKDGDTLLLPAGKYFVSTGLKCSGKSNITIRGQDAELYFGTTATGTLFQVGTADPQYYQNISAAVVVGNPVIPVVVNKEQVHVGDSVYIYNSTPIRTPGSDGYYDGVYSRITAIADSSITLEIAPNNTFVADKLRSAPAVANVIVEGLKVYTGGINISNTGINLNNAYNSIIRHCGVYGPGRTGIAITGINCRVEDCQITDWKDLNAPDGAHIGYGIALTGHNVIAYQNHIAHCKHSITTSGMLWLSTGIIYEKNMVYGDSDSQQLLDMHPNSHGTIHDNRLYGVNTLGIAVRGENQNVTSNHIYFGDYGQSVKTAINVGESHSGNAAIANNHAYNLGTGTMIALVSDCSIKNMAIRDNFADGNGVYIATPKTYTLENIVIDGGTGGAIMLNPEVHNVKIRNVNIEVGKKNAKGEGVWALGIFVSNANSTGVIIDGATITHHNTDEGNCIRLKNKLNRIRNCTLITTTSDKNFLVNDVENSGSTIEYQFEQLQ